MNIIKYELETPDASGDIVSAEITLEHRVPSNATRARIRPLFDENKERVDVVKQAFDDGYEIIKESLGEAFTANHPDVGTLMTGYAQKLHDQVVDFTWKIFDVIVDRSQLTTAQKDLITSEHFRMNCDFEAVQAFVTSFRKRAQI